MNLETLLQGLGESEIEKMLADRTKAQRLNIMDPAEYLQKLKVWYHAGYMTDAGNIKTGREVILECVKNKGSFAQNFIKYIDSLSVEEVTRMKLRIHTQFRSVGRHLGKGANWTLVDFFALI